MRAYVGCCLILAGGLQGCVVHLAPDDSNPVPLKDALAVLDRDLRSTYPARLGAVDTPEGVAAITQVLITARCADDSVDPLQPVITGAISIAVQGSISKAAGATGTVGATPSLALAYTVTHGQQQQITLPMTFVPLRTLPDFYLGQNLANFNGLTDAQKKPFVDKLIFKQQLLTKLIADLPTYDKAKCTDTQKHPVVPYSMPIN